MDEEYIYIYDLKKMLELHEKTRNLLEAKTQKSRVVNSFNNYCKNILFKTMAVRKPIEILSFNDLINYDYSNKCVNYDYDIYIYHKLFYFKHEFDIFTEIKKYHKVLFKEFCKSNNKLLNKIKKIINFLEDDIQKKELNIICNKYLTKKKFNKGTKYPSSGEQLIINFLDKLSQCKEYLFFYYYSHRWNFCRDKLPLEYDFYCVMFHYNKFFQFVIEYDGDQHYDKIKLYDFDTCHRHDILKQYYLAQLNIHLLRLTNNSDIKKSIIDFINKIILTNQYVIINAIKPIKELFNDNTAHKGLSQFYNLNKIFYYESKKNEIIDEDIMPDMVLKLKNIDNVIVKKKTFDTSYYIKKNKSEFLSLLNKLNDDDLFTIDIIFPRKNNSKETSTHSNDEDIKTHYFGDDDDLLKLFNLISDHNKKLLASGIDNIKEKKKKKNKIKKRSREIIVI